MARHDVRVEREPALMFAEFYDAALKTPELAVYVIRIGEDGRFTFEDANDFVAGIAGKSLSDIRGRAVEEVLLPEVADCVTTHMRTVIETGQPLAYERTLELPSGRVSFKTSLIPVNRGSRGTKYVVGLTRDATPEISLIEQARHQASLLKTLGIALPSAVCVLDMESHRVRFIGGDLNNPTNLQWREETESEDRPSSAQFFHPEDWPRAEAHWEELAALKDGEVRTISFRMATGHGEYRRQVHRETVFSRDAEGKVKLVLSVSEDVSEHDKVQQTVRDLSAQMMTLQIEERRRIAQELHDSTGQNLSAAALSLSNARMRHVSSHTETDASMLAMIDDAAQCLSEVQREIQVLSYLLHPPHLHSQGLIEAIEAFAKGFARRAGLKVSIDIAPGANDIDDDTAVHLFRVCQEALTNVYRHADAHKVRVELEVDESIRLTIRDDGVGFDVSAGEILGVGLPGMRERMARLGGAVDISSNSAGTLLVANIPLTTRIGTAT